MHGDLGMVAASDVVVAISYSGETTELNGLLVSLKKRGTGIIAMTGEPTKENIDLVITAGAEKCLAKPIEPGLLLEIIGLK